MSQQVKDARARVELAESRLRLETIALQRKQVKARKMMLSTYQAAEKNRTNRDWRPRNVSADSAIFGDLSVLHPRARQMVRDDAHAASAVGAFKRNVVGTGINASFAARDAGGKSLSVFNKMADGQFYDWARNPKLVDRERRRNFAQIQKWAIAEAISVGEAFVIMGYEERPRHCGLVLQCVESEQLDTTIYTYEGREVRGGVEVDQYGAAVAYHIYSRHPNDVVGLPGDTNFFRDDLRPNDKYNNRASQQDGSRYHGFHSVRVEADRVLHVFDPDRVRQTRGVSRLAPVLIRLRNLGMYDEAQLLAARAEACIGMTITSDPTSMDRLGLEDAEGSTGSDANGNDELAMQPLMIARLNPGDKAETFIPQRPGGQYTPFVQQQLRATAAGVGVSYEQIARDFTNGTYSSQRQGMLEDRREYEPLQQLLIMQLCQPVAEEFTYWSVLEGRLPAPGYAKNPDLYHYIEWRGQGWEWIDPEKQAKAVERMLALGLTTKQIEALAIGRDWRELAHQRSEEMKLEEELGIPSLTPDMTPQPIAEEPAPEESPAPKREPAEVAA